VAMEPLTLYNVKRGVWHSCVLDPTPWRWLWRTATPREPTLTTLSFRRSSASSCRHLQADRLGYAMCCLILLNLD